MAALSAIFRIKIYGNNIMTTWRAHIDIANPSFGLTAYQKAKNNGFAAPIERRLVISEGYGKYPDFKPKADPVAVYDKNYEQEEYKREEGLKTEPKPFL